MADELNDFLAERRLEDAIWARFAEAAKKVGCPIDQAEGYFEMLLDSCKPIEMQDDPRGWGGKRIRLDGPKDEKEVHRAQYRAALAKLRDQSDAATLELIFADLARDAEASNESKH
jgi:hypothetical protein